jgi:glutathione peroxidase
MPSRRTVLAAILAAVAAPLGAAVALAEGSQGGPAHTFVFKTLDGAGMPLAAYRGKLLLVVNTASECAFTRQFADLQVLWETYRDRGLVVIGAPSNDFGGQEPGTAQQIKEVCSGEFGVTFPMTAKVAVRGQDVHPFFAWAERTAGQGNGPRWNFHKYLVSVDGRLIGSFPSPMNPRDPRIVAAIEANLPPTH